MKDELIEQLAAEAERGYALDQLREVRQGFCAHCGNPIRRAGTNEEWTHSRTGFYRCPNGRPTVATEMRRK